MLILSFIKAALKDKEVGSKYCEIGDKFAEIGLCVVSEDEQKIIRTFLSLKGGEAIDFQPMSEQLFMWVKKWIG